MIADSGGTFVSIENIIKPSELDQIQPLTAQLRERLAAEKDKPLDTIVKEFAENHGVNSDIVKKYCKLLLIGNNEDENVESQPVASPLDREPQPGDIFEVEIQDIRSFGFIVTTPHRYRGLVHIKEIAQEFIALPEYYGQVGDKHLAKVIYIDERGLSLSFKALGGLKPVYRYSETVKAGAPSERINEIAAKSPFSRFEEEGKKITALVSEATGGIISTRAEYAFQRMIRNYGIVDVTLQLQETLRDLDIGVLLAKIVESKINGVDLEYIVTSHTIDAYLERVESGISRTEAEETIISKCKNGKIVFDNSLVRIIQHGDLAFPCVSTLNGWKIKTTLFYKMIVNKTIDQLTKEYY